MNTLRVSPDEYARSPLRDRLAIARHELVCIEARRVIKILKWLAHIGETALMVARPNPHSDRDEILDLGDAIELARAELSLSNRDPYYACSAGKRALDRMAWAIAAAIGESKPSEWDIEQLWTVARKVMR